MQTIWIRYFLVMFLFVSLQVEAKLQIEITKGMAAAVPIAVTPFESKGFPSTEDIAQVVQDDLRMSGYFNPISRTALPGGVGYSSIPVATWQTVGVENVVLGQVYESTPGRYSVRFELWDVYKSKDKAALAVRQGELVARQGAQDHILLTQSFDNIAPDQFRALAHHISDVIFEKLTGIRGAFSTRIAYVLTQESGSKRDYVLEVADVDGYNPKPLMKSSEPIMSPSWSPDGKRLAFVSFENNRSQIFIVDVKTGNRSKVSKFPGINGAPTWSPDGRKLAVVLSKEQNPNIYIIDLVTRSMQQLTTGLNISTEPNWSPDGRHLLFTSNRGGKPQVYELDFGTMQIKRLTFKGSYNARASYTPDRKAIVMVHKSDDGQYRIARQNLGNGELTYLTYARQDESPSVSPNGAMVLYGTQAGERGVLGVVSIDGRGQLRLPAREGSVQEPAWSPFLS